MAQFSLYPFLGVITPPPGLPVSLQLHCSTCTSSNPVHIKLTSTKVKLLHDKLMYILLTDLEFVLFLSQSDILTFMCHCLYLFIKIMNDCVLDSFSKPSLFCNSNHFFCSFDLEHVEQCLCSLQKGVRSVH